jgi:hypothetical protein
MQSPLNHLNELHYHVPITANQHNAAVTNSSNELNTAYAYLAYSYRQFGDMATPQTVMPYVI